MASRTADVFGFEELEKAFLRMEKRYKSRGDAMLAAQASQAAKRLRQIAPVNTGKLKKSVRTLKPKEFKGGKVIVSRIQNTAPHMHLVELGHNVYTSRRKVGKITKYNKSGRKAAGITSHGRVEGKFMIDKILTEMRSRFPKEAEKLIDKITKEVQI